ncbi:MAG TPA: phosphotransferase, partial [Acidimicrobiales bacterium]|nr:phosphotransferase [Acidimicrobiales bacterium]
MRTPPDGIGVDDVARALDRHWNAGVDRLDYLPEGGGAYHWVSETTEDQRWFVTCDDLDTKPWLGADRETVFKGLVAAYRTAVDLRREAGLGFVVAPLPALRGEPAIRLGARHSLAVFPFVEGVAGRWGEPIGPGEEGRLVGLLAELHQSTPTAADDLPQHVELPGRQRLEDALDELGRPWSGGPFSEPTRRELAERAEVVSGWVASFDDLVSRLAGSPFEPVLTHGEPHPGNLIRTGGGFALV